MLFATSVFWKMSADRSNDPAFAARVHRRLRRADSRIVVPGALLTFAGGYSMIRLFGARIATQPVALWGLILMFAALAVWYFGMRPLATRLAVEAEACEANRQPLSSEYGARSVAWLACAALANVLVIVVAVMMTVAPPRP